MNTIASWLERLSSRHAVLGLSILAALVLQSAVFPHLTILGVKPDLLMIIVASWGLLYGRQEGFVAGLAAGLVQDLAFGQYIGLFSLTMAIVGFGVGVVESKIFKETIWVPTAAVGAAVFTHDVTVWLCLRTLHVPAPAVDLVRVAAPAALYSMLAAPLIYRRFLVYRIKERARERTLVGGSSQAVGRR